MRALVERSYGGVLASTIRGETPSRKVAITFDDGHRSVFDKALPVLERLGLKATVFVCTELVGGVLPTDPSAPALSWSELRELAEAGWEIGSHTATHARLTMLSDVELRAELRDSREHIESELGSVCSSLAYPYGLVDRRVEEEAASAGYVIGFTVPRRLYPPTVFRWPRVSIFDRDGPLSFGLKTSKTGRRARATFIGAQAATAIRSISR